MPYSRHLDKNALRKSYFPTKAYVVRDFGGISSPFQIWNLGDFFPNFEKKSISSKNFFFLFEDWDFHSVNLLQFNGNSMCNS